jgi:hypothetical protein
VSIPLAPLAPVITPTSNRTSVSLPDALVDAALLAVVPAVPVPAVGSVAVPLLLPLMLPAEPVPLLALDPVALAAASVAVPVLVASPDPLLPPLGLKLSSPEPALHPAMAAARASGAAIPRTRVRDGRESVDEVTIERRMEISRAGRRNGRAGRGAADEASRPAARFTPGKHPKEAARSLPGGQVPVPSQFGRALKGTRALG